MMKVGQWKRGWQLSVAAMVLTLVTVGAGALTAQGDNSDEPGNWPAVFTLTNDANGNELAVFEPDGNGGFEAPQFFATGGKGTGAGLGNAGALALSNNSQFLYAVNPASDTITVFQLGQSGPRAVQVIASGGANPISLAVHGHLLYVLNAGGAVGDADSIAGFKIDGRGGLSPLKNSVRSLSAANTGPAQIGFSANGTVLTVTEKTTNLITLFAVDSHGVPSARVFVDSNGQTPFGFAFTNDDLLVVSEAHQGPPGSSAVSSYELDEGGFLDLVSGSVSTHQAAACWIAITDDDRFAYSANTGSKSISGFKIGGQGNLTLLDTDGITATTGAVPTDLYSSGKALFVLNSGDGSVGAYAIGNDGSLTPLAVGHGLPPTHPTGLVAR